MPAARTSGGYWRTTLQQGRYASASEVIRDGLRSLEDREKFRAMKLEALRAEIQKGADSGAGIPAAIVFADIRARIAQESAGRSGKQ